MANDPKTHNSKLGPIPPDNFDNDLVYNPNVDTKKGSMYDRLKKQIEGDKKND